jgi:hypothetical protein
MMNLAAAQLGAMIRYEMLMHWRRRSLPAIAAFFLIALVGFTLLGFNVLGNASQVQRITPIEGGVELQHVNPQTGELETVRYMGDDAANFPTWVQNIDLISVQNTLRLMYLVGIATQALFVALMPMLADTIPFDKQVKVRELLNTLPLPSAVYLGGKVLGVWAGLFIGLGLVAAAFGVYSRVQFGVFDIGLYVRLWLVLVLPGALIASGYTVVVNTLSPSRRVAVLLGVALIPLAFAMYYTITMTLFIDMGQIFRPDNRFGGGSFDSIMNAFFANLITDMAQFAIGLALLWGGMWVLLRTQQAR